MPTPTLKDVCSELGRVRHKWFTIGVHLGIPRYILEQYKKEDDPLSAAVDYWLRGNIVDPAVPITWEHLVEALKAVDESGYAGEISKKYNCRNQGSRVQNGNAPSSQPSRHSTRAPLSPPSQTVATPPQSAPAQSAPAGSIEFSESMNTEQLCAYLRSEQMPENDLKIIKESGVGGAVFSYASEEDWKAMKISLPGLINIRRIKEKISKGSPASPPPPQSSSQITSQPSPPTTSPPYSASMPELREFRVSEADANKNISDLHMQEITRSYCSRWRQLRPYLELSEIVVSDVERTHSVSEDDRRRAFFRVWKEQKGSDATYGRLIYALLKIDCRSDAESVKQLLINT